MKSWFRSWKRKGLGVEAQLRASRPKAPEQLVRSISMRINGRPLYAGRRARFGLVAVLGAVSLAVLGATGGFSYAATSIQSAVNATTGVAHFSGVLHFSTSSTAHSAAGNQYGVAPHITKVSPTTKIIGGTTVLTVSGTNIQANSVTVASISVTPITGHNTSTSVQVVAPSHPSGTITGPVHIVTDYGSDSSQSLTIYAVPTIGNTGLSATTLEPGLTLTITGTGFTDATGVKFGTKVVKPTSVDSDTQLTVIVPTGLAASGNVFVTGPAGTSAASAQTFTFTATAPTIKSFSPTSGVAAGQSSTATTVDIIGTGFDSSDTVKFNGVTAASQTFVSATEFTATAPAGATAGPISVVDTVGGAGISKASFTPIKNPSISTVTPSAAPASGAGSAVGQPMTITGSNLQGVGTTVTFTGNSAAQKTTDVKGTTDQISVKVPKDAASGTLTVSNAAGSDSVSFTLIVLPTVTSFSATHNPAISGDTLTINGSGFNGVTKVAIGKSVIDSADFTTFTGTQIKLTIPTGTATNSLSVTNAAGTAKTKDKLVMAAAPVIKASPLTGVALGQTNPASTLTFTGTGFNGADGGTSTVVTFAKVGGGTVDATPLTLTDTTLTVKAPSNAAAGSPIVSTDAGDTTARAKFTPVKNPSPTSGTPTVDDGGDFGGKPGTTTITLSGTWLNGVSTSDVTVTFPSVTTPQKTKVSPDGSSLTVKIPAGASDGTLTVTNSAGSGTITGFIVIVRAPSLTGPLTWTHGTTITVTGSNFLGITSVKVGSNTIAKSGISITDNTHMTITLPAGAKTGLKQKVTMMNPAGTGTLTGVTIN